MNILEIINYLKNPTVLAELKVLNAKDSLKLTLKSFLYIILFAFISGIIIQVPLKLLGLAPAQKEIEPTLYHLFAIVIFAPIAEEIIFRGILVFSKFFLLTSPTLLIFLLIRNRFDIDTAVITVSIFSSIMALLLFTKRISEHIEIYYTQYFQYLFYFFVLFFGLFHLANFQSLNSTQLLISPLLVINQLFMGFILSYVRVNYKSGLIICIISHILLNFIFSLQILINLTCTN